MATQGNEKRTYDERQDAERSDHKVREDAERVRSPADPGTRSRIPEVLDVQTPDARRERHHRQRYSAEPERRPAEGGRGHGGIRRGRRRTTGRHPLLISNFYFSSDAGVRPNLNSEQVRAWPMLPTAQGVLGSG